MAFLSLFVALLTAIAVTWPPGRRRGLRAATFVLVILAGLGAAAYWYRRRPQPPPRTEALFRGITYVRDVRTSPRPIVAHVVSIDLRDPAISFFVTPEDPSGGLEVRADVTSRFLLKYGVQVAINGDFFLPWWSNGPHDYHPHLGEPAYVLGVAISEGREYGHRVAPFSTLLIDDHNRVSILETTDPQARLPRARFAVSGKQIILSGGARTPVVRTPAQLSSFHPRSAAALDRERRTLLLVAVDGRQPGYSQGVNLDELAAILLDHGAWEAMNLDGGGSTSIAIDDGNGGARQLNVPYHTRIPWRERPVANHLGVFAAPLQAGVSK